MQQQWIYTAKLEDDANFVMYCLNNLKQNIENKNNEEINTWKNLIIRKIEIMSNQGKILSEQVDVWKVKLNQIKSIDLNTINNNINSNSIINDKQQIGIEVCKRLENVVQKHWVERLGLVEDAENIMNGLKELKRRVLNNKDSYWLKKAIISTINEMYDQGKIQKEQVDMWKIQLKYV